MDYQNYSELLKNKLQELNLRLESLKKDATQSHSADFSDQAQERENDEVVDEIGNETRATIAEIRKALSRIEEGSYGVCETCGEDINPSRLDVLPESTKCIDCAE